MQLKFSTLIINFATVTVS